MKKTTKRKNLIKISFILVLFSEIKDYQIDLIPGPRSKRRFSIINARTMKSVALPPPPPNDIELLFDQRYGSITLANIQLTRDNKGLNRKSRFPPILGRLWRRVGRFISPREISKFTEWKGGRKGSSVTSSTVSLPGFMIPHPAMLYVTRISYGPCV